MVFITIVTGAYKPTYILGASHCYKPTLQTLPLQEIGSTYHI